MNPMHATCSRDTERVLLLCGGLGRPRTDDPRPLSPGEYGRLAAWMSARGLRPADLPRFLAGTTIPDGSPPAIAAGRPVRILTGSGAVCRSGFDPARLLALLSRRAEFQSWLAWLGSCGLWVLGIHDTGYPARLVDRLGLLAPPLLHGCGDLLLLDHGGLAVVGARDAGDQALSFARTAGCRCAQEGIRVVSGGARGVDQAAMLGALEAGGSAAGVLPGSLHHAARSRLWKELLPSGRLALVTPFEPDAGFSTGAAMGRNRFIYQLADWALVVEAAAGKGGTWTGAVEALQRKVPVFVRMEEGVPAGNAALVQLGAIPVRSDDLHRPDLPAWLDDMAQHAADGQLSLF